MNLVPDGTAIASTCQHRIPRLGVLERMAGKQRSLWSNRIWWTAVSCRAAIDRFCSKPLLAKNTKTLALLLTDAGPQQ
jgi:hypothetical protein